MLVISFSGLPLYHPLADLSKAVQNLAVWGWLRIDLVLVQYQLVLVYTKLSISLVLV